VETPLTNLARGLWRVLRADGWMLLAVPRGQAESLDCALSALVEEFGADCSLISRPDDPDGGSDALVRKPPGKIEPQMDADKQG
jgi:hypothetical protein